jgi:hypothetical protein
MADEELNSLISGIEGESHRYLEKVNKENLKIEVNVVSLNDLR